MTPSRRRVVHHGSLGDVVYCLPPLLRTGPVELLLDARGGWWRWLYADPLSALGRLLEAVGVSAAGWDGRAAFDFAVNSRRDEYRGYWAKTLTLVDRYAMGLGQPLGLAAEPWLSVEPRREAEVVFARSGRYRSPFFDWAPLVARHRRRAVFVGSPSEHREFVERFGRLPRLPTADLYDVAAAIAGSRLFVGNQSSPFALAVGTGARAVLELCPAHPDCLFDLPAVESLSVYDGGPLAGEP